MIPHEKVQHISTLQKIPVNVEFAWQRQRQSGNTGLTYFKTPTTSSKKELAVTQLDTRLWNCPCQPKTQLASCKSRAWSHTKAISNVQCQIMVHLESPLRVCRGRIYNTMTMSGLAWVTKVTMGMLRLHIWETVGLSLLPFKQSRKCCLWWLWGDVKGFWGKLTVAEWRPQMWPLFDIS